MCYAYAMEPYTAVADWERRRADGVDRPRSIRTWSATTWPAASGCRFAHVRVIVPYVGGGYGSKSYTKIEPLTAALALRAGRPVRLAAERRGGDPDDARRRRAGPHPHGLRRARAGSWRARPRILLDTGAYAENSPLVGRKAANRLGGPYRIPALEVDLRRGLHEHGAGQLVPRASARRR